MPTPPSSSPPPWALALETHLTAPRLTSYMVKTRGDKARAMALYHWNVVVSSAFQETLAYVEVVLRNAMDGQLQARFSQAPAQAPASWWDMVQLDARGADDVAAASSRASRKALTHDRTVAELNFGFWRFLLASGYEQTLWTPALQHAFPGLSTRRRSDIAGPVGRLHNLRNRIAHHEPIHRATLADRLDDVVFVLRCIDRDVESFVSTWCRIPTLLAAKP